MKTCKVCGNPKSKYVMNNRMVCLNCDDLVFDLEIECDEDSNKSEKSEVDKAKLPQVRKTPIIAKK